LPGKRGTVASASLDVKGNSGELFYLLHTLARCGRDLDTAVPLEFGGSLVEELRVDLR